MGNTSVKGYVDIWGKHGVNIFDHTGPASYVAWTAPSTGGDVLTAKQLGLRSLDFVHGTGSDTSGTYYVRPVNTGTGMRQSWILVWYVLATGVQVAAGVNLAGITIRLSAIGG